MIVDDELIIMIRQNNEEALYMLLHRYENAIRYIVHKIYSKMHFCGLEKSDLKSCALETFFRSIYAYEEEKSCFYSFWKLLTERELYTLIKKHNTKGNQMLSYAISFDNPLFDEDGNTSYSEQIIDETANVVRRYEAQEQLLKFSDINEEYFSSIEKEIIKKRMQGYSYNEIVACLHVEEKDIDRALKKSKKVLNNKQ